LKRRLRPSRIAIDPLEIIKNDAASHNLMLSVGTVRYLDPGTGSMILQYLAAVILTGLLLIKTYFKRLKQKIKDVLNLM
jgi:hypothetical protein